MPGTPRTRSLPLAVAALAVAALAAAGVAGASWHEADGGGSRDSGSKLDDLPGDNSARNPCLDEERAKRLRCPDIRVSKPSDLYVQRRSGRVLLRATNKINSRGEGPIELHGRRINRTSMRVVQAIYKRKRSGGRLVVPTRGRIDLKYAKGHGRFWKFRHPVRFELWSLDRRGRPQGLVRTGPKIHYCFRDYARTSSMKRSPRRWVYPACSQDRSLRRVRLGTSVGWSDIYPATYFEQWIDVTGLRGRFLYVHRGDPFDHIYESNERNNVASTRIRLPWRGPRRSVGRY